MPPLDESAYSLVLDQGGHSSRALVLDAAGKTLATAQRSVDTVESPGGRVEQDGAAILTGLRECIGEIRHTLGGEAGRIRQAGLAVQRGSVLCWDRVSGEVLSPVLSWRDRRTLGDDLQGLSADAVRAATGLRFSPYGGAAKLAWCLKNLPLVSQALAQGRLAMGPLGSFLVHGLLADQPFVVDHSLAQRSLLWSRHDRNWSGKLLTAFGLPRQALPEVSDSRADFGPFRDLPTCHLQRLMGDQNAVPWCVGMPQMDDVLINMGTGAFMLRPIGPGQEPGPFQYSLLQSGREPEFALEASLHGAGAAIAWLESASGQRIQAEDIQASLGRVQNPPLFLNTVDGLGSPWWQSGIEPVFVRQGRVIAVADLGIDSAISGLLESLAFLIRVNLDIMESLAGPAHRLVLAGGLSQSRELCQRIATLLDRDVHRLTAVEATAMGLFYHLAEQSSGHSALERIPPHSAMSVENRYREWLSIMPPVPLFR
jgi:glycerol kinase